MGKRETKTRSFFILALLIFFFIASGVLFRERTSILFSYLKTYQDNYLLFFFALFLVKFLGIVYPPLPGGVFLILSVPLIGWQIPFLANFLGSFLGGVVNYWVARLWGKRLIARIAGEEFVRKIEQIKIKKGREMEFLFFARIGLAGMLEGVQYVAGLLRFPFIPYLLVSALSDLLIGFLGFWLLAKGLDLFSFKSYSFLALFSLVVLLILWKGKGRYLE